MDPATAAEPIPIIVMNPAPPVQSPSPTDDRVMNPSRAVTFGLTAALVIGAGAIGILVGSALRKPTPDEISFVQQGYTIRVVRDRTSPQPAWAWSVARQNGGVMREYESGSSPTVGAAMGQAGNALDAAIAANWK